MAGGLMCKAVESLRYALPNEYTLICKQNNQTREEKLANTTKHDKRNWRIHTAHVKPTFSTKNSPTCKTSLKSSNISDKNWVKGVSYNTLHHKYCTVQHAQAKKQSQNLKFHRKLIKSN